MDKSPKSISSALDKAHIYIMPQPREISWGKGKCDLRKARGIAFYGKEIKNPALLSEFRQDLAERAETDLPIAEKAGSGFYIRLYLADESVADKCPVDYSLLKEKGEEACAVSAGPDGVTAAACGETGLFYAMETIVQMFSYQREIKSVTVFDYPAVKYRGMMYDVSRGQMPKPETLKSLIRLFARGKSNMTELYLEDMLKFEKYPDIAPDDAFTRDEYLSLSRCAAGYGMELHPMMQVLGHMERIASRGDYKKFMVAMPEGGAQGHAWTQTIDVRRPEAVQFVCDLLDEVCLAFPGKYINVDVTEIADFGFTASGTPAEELPGLMAGYINTLNKVCNRHGMSLSVAQSPLRAEGHLNGLGKVLDRLDKDIVVGSYYTSEFYGGWDHDYPVFQKQGRAFWAMPWLSSHTRFMPDVTFSMDFSDITMERAMPYGAEGSITCDWGDFGHIHLPGVLIYPSMYHFAACWNGCGVDRDYFDKAFCLAVFGLKDDALAKGIVKTGDINQIPIERLDGAGNVFTHSNYMTGNYNLGFYFRELFDGVLDNEFMAKAVNPDKRTEAIGKAEVEGYELMSKAASGVRFNREFYDEILWSARPYHTIYLRMLLRSQKLKESISPADFAKGLEEMADYYTKMRADYISLYEASCRDSAQYRGNIRWMQESIDKALALAEEQKEK
ncbi:MAG: family 20 glycosylhydrolase [Abditibacteriota bacterium]|nr:family 20 glycosylhydrolase [Abditibacteriota bacterium]